MPSEGDDVQFEPAASTGQEPNSGEGRKYEEVTVIQIRPKLDESQQIALRKKLEPKYGYLDPWALECLHDMEKDKENAENPEIPGEDTDIAGEKDDSSMQASNKQTKTARTSKQGKKKSQPKVEISKAEDVKGFLGDQALEKILLNINGKSNDEQTPVKKKKWQPPKDAPQNESDEEEEDKGKEPPSSEAFADTSDNNNKVDPEIKTPELPQPEPTPDEDNSSRMPWNVQQKKRQKLKKNDAPSVQSTQGPTQGAQPPFPQRENAKKGQFDAPNTKPVLPLPKISPARLPSREVQPEHSYSAVLQPARELGQGDGENNQSPEEKNLQCSQKLEADFTFQIGPEVNESDHKVETPEEKDLRSSQKLEAQNGPEVDVQDKNNENPQAQGDGEDNQSPEKKEFEGSQRVEAGSTFQIGPEVNESDHKVETPEEKDLRSSQKLEAQNGPEVDVQDKNNENPQAQGDGEDNQSPEEKNLQCSQKLEADSTFQIGPEVNESDHKVENPEDQVQVMEADKVLKQDPNSNESRVEEDDQSQKEDSDQSEGSSGDPSEDEEPYNEEPDFIESDFNEPVTPLAETMGNYKFSDEGNFSSEETELPLPTNVLARTSGTQQRQELKVMPPRDDENQVPAMPPPMGRHEKDRNEAQGHGVSKSKTPPKIKTERAPAQSGHEPSEDEDRRESSGNNRSKTKTLKKRKTGQPPAQFGDKLSECKDRRERQQNADNNRPKSKSPPKRETKQNLSQSRDESEEESEPQDKYEEDQVNDEHYNLNKRRDERRKDSNGDQSNSDTRGSRNQNGFMIKIAFEIEISAPGMEIKFSKSNSN